MSLTTVREIYKNREQYLSQEISAGGWVKGIRDSRAFRLIVVSNSSHFETLRIIYHDTMPSFDEICKLSVGAAVIVRGTLVAAPEAKQPFEIQATEVTAEDLSVPDYPLQKKRHGFEYLRTISHLHLRTSTFQAVLRVHSPIAYAIHQYLQEWDLAHVYTPLVTTSDCGGAREMLQAITPDLDNVPKTEGGAVDFSQDFLNEPANLTVNRQLNGEIHATTFRNIYTFGPIFRMGSPNTTHRAVEFQMVEPEMAFVGLDNNMALVEGTSKYAIRYVLGHVPEKMNFFNQFVDKGLLEYPSGVLNSEPGHMTYTEAIKILGEYNDAFEYKVFWGCDLQTKHERYLTEEIYRKSLFVTDYPKKTKAFCIRLNDDSKTMAAVDCPVSSIGKVTGGNQRKDSYDEPLSHMEELGLKLEDYESYLDLRRYGSIRHSDFGLDFRHCVMYLTDMGSIRGVTPLPRTVNNCDL